MSRLMNIFSRAREAMKERRNFLLLIFFLCFLIFIAGGGLSQSEKWRITDVSVQGNAVISTEKILASASTVFDGNYYFVYSKKNSFIFPRTQIEQTLLFTYPELNTVSITKTGFHSIKIQVTERKPYALWCGETVPESGTPSQCYFIDHNGYLFNQAPMFSEGVYLEVYAGLDYVTEHDPLRARIKEKDFKATEDIYENFKQKIAEPSKIIIKSDDEILVVLNRPVEYQLLHGVEVRMSQSLSPATTTAFLLKALPVQFPVGTTTTKRLQYIDVRFGNKIFFGFDE